MYVNTLKSGHLVIFPIEIQDTSLIRTLSVVPKVSVWVPLYLRNYGRDHHNNMSTILVTPILLKCTNECGLLRIFYIALDLQDCNESRAHSSKNFSSVK